MEIVLARHGEPHWEPEGRAVDDPELTPAGHAQAQRLADALDGERFDAIYASPLRRTRQTVAPVAERLGLAPRFEAWLEEIRLPRMQGKTEQEVRRYFEAAQARELDHWWDGFPGGESFRHFHERVASGIEGLLLGSHRVELHEDGVHRLWRVPGERERILIVSHEGTSAVILSHLLGIAPVPWEWIRFSKAWAAVTRLRAAPVASGSVWVLEAFNDRYHLIDLDASHE